jgi:23S rRNA (guanosine2251-2'-O)-methyltransferase
MFEIVYGRNPVMELLRARRRRLHSLLLAEGAREKATLAEIVQLARSQGVEARQVPRATLDELGILSHQGVAAQVGTYPYVSLEAILQLARDRSEEPFVLLLDCLQDPQNLGTLMRTAEAIRVHGVIIPERRAAQITPAVSSASSGAVEHLLVAQVTNLAQTIQGLKEQQLWIVALEDMPDAQLYHEANLTGPIALVVGSEGAGLRRLVRESCDFAIRLPMRGKVQSLNASVAASIALYEIWQQRRAKPHPDSPTGSAE